MQNELCTVVGPERLQTLSRRVDHAIRKPPDTQK